MYFKNNYSDHAKDGQLEPMKYYQWNGLYQLKVAN